MALDLHPFIWDDGPEENPSQNGKNHYQFVPSMMFLEIARGKLSWVKMFLVVLYS
jgi:hypothetical protein